jgi:hypothetical protein
MRWQFSRYPFERDWWWLFSFVLDCDDEPGDPSGLFMIVCGFGIGAYWPMHRKVSFEWILGWTPPRVVRW